MRISSWERQRRALLKRLRTLLSNPLTVTGTFWQATQPVSLAVNTPDVTDRVGRLLGVIASITAAVDVSDRVGRLVGHVTVDNASIPVTDNAGSLTTDTPQLPAALVGGRLSVDASGVAVPVTDNAGSLTVDAPVGTPLFARLSDGAAALIGQKAMAASLPVVIASDQSTLPVVGVAEITYHALFRLAARPYALSKAAIAANTRTQFATLYHAATATKRMRLRRVLVMFESETVAGIINFDLVKLTAAVTPATGNPAITPAPARGANVAEATALALPTTGGTEGAVIADLEFNTGITGAVSVANPPVPDLWYELFSEDEQNPMGEQESLEVAAGVAGGWAVVIDNTGATNTVKAKVKMVFTEK
jgi:hypothetical protein